MWDLFQDVPQLGSLQRTRELDAPHGGPRHCRQSQDQGAAWQAVAVTTTPTIVTKVPSADWRYLYRRSLFLGRVDTFPSVEEPGGGTNSISTQELLGFANWRDYPLFPVATSLRRAEGETKTR